MRVLAGILIFLFFTPQALGGGLFTAGLEWQTLAFRPLDEEPTPNYYGYGANLGAGYSLGRVIDFGIYANYIPLRLNSAKLAAQDAEFYSYGGEIGLRLAETILLGFRGGIDNYKLITAYEEHEVEGAWQGPGGALTLAAFWPLSKNAFGQIGVRAGTSTLSQSGNPQKRKVDTFAVTMTYVFNAVDSFKFTNSFISDFVDSLVF